MAASSTDNRPTTLAAGGGTFIIEPSAVVTWNGNITGAAGNNLGKDGGGALILGGTNTYAGSTTVATGRLQFGKTAALYNGDIASWTPGNLTVNAGATAAFNVGGSGEFTAAHIDTLKVLGTGSGGFQNGSFLGFDTTNASGGVFTYNSSIANPNGGANALGLVKLGTGTLLLGGTNTYSGDTLVQAGTLKLGAASALSPNSKLFVAAGANFDANGFAPTYADLTGAGAIDVGSGGLNVAPSGTSSFTGTLGGSGGFTMSGSGTLTLGNANTYSGTTAISGGTVKLGAAGALPSGSPVSLTSGGKLDLNGNAATLGSLTGASGTTVALTGANLSVAQGGNTTFAGVLSGTGGLNKSGSGRLTLTGTNTFSGATTITGGGIKLNGSAASSAFTLSGGGMLSGNGTVGSLTIGSGGILSPGNSPGNSPGTTSAGNTTWNGGGAFTWELNKTAGTAGTDPGWDLLSISGTLAINATSSNKFTINLTSLTLANAAGNVTDFNSTSNYSFTFVTTTGGVTGFNANAFTLDTSNFQNPFSGTWSIGQSGNNLTLNYVGSAIPEPSTYAALFGAGSLAFAAWRRRKVARCFSPRPDQPQTLTTDYTDEHG